MYILDYNGNHGGNSVPLKMFVINSLFYTSMDLISLDPAKKIESKINKMKKNEKQKMRETLIDVLVISFHEGRGKSWENLGNF